MYNAITLSQAKRLVLAPEGIRKIHISLGDTDDIIYAIKEADKESAKFTRQLAPLFKSATALITCQRIFEFVKNNIQYQVDAIGTQVIKSPSQTIFTGFADCKSMSLLIGSLFKNLGFTFRYRFTTYDSDRAKSKLVSHIYCIATIQGKDVIMDTVYGYFNKEKKYLYHTDTMPEVSYIAGINKPVVIKRVGTSLAQKPYPKRPIQRGVTISKVALFGTEEDAFIGEIQHEVGFIRIKNPFKAIAKAVSNVAKGVAKGVSNVGKGIVQATKFVGTNVAKGVSNAAKWTGTAIKDAGKGIVQAAKWTGKNVVVVVKKAGEVVKKVGEAALRYNPLTLAMRGAIALIVQVNAWGWATKLGYGSMGVEELVKRGSSESNARKLVSARGKLLNFWKDVARGTDSEFNGMVIVGFAKKAFLRGIHKSEGIGEAISLSAAIAIASGFVGLATSVFAGVTAIDDKNKANEDRKREASERAKQQEQERQDRAKAEQLAEQKERERQQLLAAKLETEKARQATPASIPDDDDPDDDDPDDDDPDDDDE